MRRDFGSHLPRILGRPLNASTITAIYAAANEAIATWEPRVEVVATQIDLEQAKAGIVNLKVIFKLQGETSKVTLVLPDLPPPSIIDESTYEEIFNSMIDEFREIQPNYTNIVEGDPVYSIAQRAAYRELNLRKQINNAYRQTLLLYATGTNLDNVVANYGLTRLVKKEAVYDENGVLVEPEVLETDEQLRIRGWLVWSALGIGTFGKYKFHALQADPQVKDAFIKGTRPTAKSRFMFSPRTLTVESQPRHYWIRLKRIWTTSVAGRCATRWLWQASPLSSMR